MEFEKVMTLVLKAVRLSPFTVDIPIDCHKRTLLYHAVKLKEYTQAELLLAAGATQILDGLILEELIKDSFSQFVQLVSKGLLLPQEIMNLVMQKVCKSRIFSLS